MSTNLLPTGGVFKSCLFLTLTKCYIFHPFPGVRGLARREHKQNHVIRRMWAEKIINFMHWEALTRPKRHIWKIPLCKAELQHQVRTKTAISFRAVATAWAYLKLRFSCNTAQQNNRRQFFSRPELLGSNSAAAVLWWLPGNTLSQTNQIV